MKITFAAFLAKHSAGLRVQIGMGFLRGMHRVSRVRLMAAATLFYLFGPALIAAPASQQWMVTLASGPKDGMYHRLAQGIQRRLRDEGIPVRIVALSDFAESPSWLEAEMPGRGERFAFAQQDMAGEHFRRSAATSIRVVDRISLDYLHVFVRESLRLDSVTDLAARRVWAGEQGSATRHTASHLLDSLGASLETPLTYTDLEKMSWEPGDLRKENYAVRELRSWLRDGRLDAAMLMAPAGAPEVFDILMHGRCSLLSLAPGTLRRLHSEDSGNHPFLRHIAIGSMPRWTYVNQEEPIATLAVPILLLARDGTDPDLARKVRDAARLEWDSLGADSRRGRGWQAPTAVSMSRLRFLKGLGKETPSLARTIAGYVVMAVLTGAAVLGIFRMRRLLARWIRNIWRHYPGLCKIVLPLAGGVLLITWLAYRAERAINENFSSFWESWWSITVYIFSGLEDRVPYTTQGRILVMFGLALGAICSAVATGWTAAVFVRRERRMSPKLRDHCLLLNWNERGIDLVRELHHPVLQKNGRATAIVVLTENEELTLYKLKQTGHGLEEAFEDVDLLIGDPGDEATLRKANAQHARTVVILANEKHGDERTIRAILQLRKIARAERRDLHVVAELVDGANDSIVDELSEDFPGLLESVSGLKLRTYLLSQAVLSQGIVGFYKDLLSVEDQSNEVYTAPIPSEAVGMSFHDYAAFVIRSSAMRSPMIPVGVQRTVAGRPQLFTNPQAGRHEARLQLSDRLVLIAYGPPREALPVPEAPAELEPVEESLAS